VKGRPAVNVSIPGAAGRGDNLKPPVRPVAAPPAQIDARTMPLRCVECSLITGVFARGWRGYLTDDEWSPAEVVVLCPTCSEREFESWPRFEADEDQQD
jgi:hypothetical protein